MPYKLKKVKGGWQVTSPGHPQGFKKKPHKNKEDAMDQLAAIKIHAKESIPLIKSMLQEAMIGQIGHDRLSNLSDLLSQVETGKLSAVVAADMAGLIDPSEESIGEDASLARLKWEIESLEGSIQESSFMENTLDKKTPTEEELASKYGVDISTVREAVRTGTEVELEHTNDHEVAKEIALDHLGEKLDYYDKLKEIE